MHFSSTLLLFSATLAQYASALPAELDRRALTYPGNCSVIATQAANDIRGIDTAVRGLNSSVTAYQGGLLAALPLIAGVTDIHLVNRKAYLDAQVVCATTAEQSTSIVEVVEDTVGVSIPSTVSNTISKGPQLKQAGIASELVASLKLLQSDHDTYSAALSKSVNPSVQARADAVVLLIHNAIQVGIDYFSTS